MAANAKNILAQVLKPYSYDDFFEKIVEKKPLTLLGSDGLNRANIIGGDPKDAILATYKTHASKLTCHALAPKTPPPQPRAVANASEFQALIREYHSKDYTVRIPESANLSEPLQKFIRALEVIFGNPSDVVVFWSNPGAKAPIHHDEYDLICIQLEGKKKWFISEDPPILPNTWKKIGETPPLMEKYQTIDVAPGDLIYLPRGTAHTVHSLTESIHLSIGFVPVTTRDTIIAVLDYLSDQEISFRKSATKRADTLSENKDANDAVEAIRLGLEKLQDACQSNEFIADALKFRQSRMIIDLPKIQSKHNNADLTINSLIKHSDLAIANFDITNETIDLSLPGEHIFIHPGAEESVRFILATKEFLVSDIPGKIDNDVRVALVSRLLTNGLLEHAI